MSNFGCSLIWGHPQAPTGARSIIELIEELVVAGGGIGLHTGWPLAIPDQRWSSR
jgi:acetyl-CoA acetyltransferase